MIARRRQAARGGFGVAVSASRDEGAHALAGRLPRASPGTGSAAAGWWPPTREERQLVYREVVAAFSSRSRSVAMAKETLRHRLSGY